MFKIYYMKNKVAEHLMIPFGFPFDTFCIFIKQENLRKDTQKTCRGGGFYDYFCILLLCDLYMYEHINDVT